MGVKTKSRFLIINRSMTNSLLNLGLLKNKIPLSRIEDPGAMKPFTNWAAIHLVNRCSKEFYKMQSYYKEEGGARHY